ncbi:MAG TPA: aminotransferase class IV [Terriglobales bacterium]|nr:aminotransferase class IV [Terriglobales bacterium]
MDIMHKQVFHNGRVLPLNEVRLSPGQAGLLNGWGVFSTVRIYEGHPFAFDHHWERLARDAEKLMVPLPCTKEQCYEGVMALIKANRLMDGCMRIYFVLNKVGIWCSDEDMPETDWIMYTVDLPMRVGPVKLAMQENGRQAMHPLSGTKVTSWLQNVWVVEKAHQRGFEDTILLNEFGNVTEATAANLYIVKNGKVVTAPLASGCLAGVSRLILKEIASGAGISLVERDFTPEELFAADEVFITSTTRQVQPVSHIESHILSQAPGPITTKLAELFNQYVQREHAAQLAAK